MEFWRMLKQGHDHFQVTGQPPKVDVCAKRYVFNSTTVEGVTFNPTAECPDISVPDPIRLAVQEKAAKPVRCCPRISVWMSCVPS